MIVNIQILRGLAALWVFFHHSHVHFHAMGLSSVAFEALASLGYMGVDVFFVISGLVMAKTTEHLKPGLSSASEFIKKRFIRVYLGYWPVFVLTLLIIYWLNPAKLGQANLVQSTFLAGIYMENLLIPQAWSLPFELYFYALIALSLWLKLKNLKGLSALLLALVILKLSLIDYRQNEFLDLIFSPMLIEFLIGYYLWVYRDQLVRNSWVILYLVLLVVSLFLAVEYYLVATSFRSLVLGIFGASLLALMMVSEGKIPQAIVKVFKPIGDSSYTLYLLHFVLLLMFVDTGLRHWLVTMDWALPGFLAMMLLVVLFSHGFYRLIERPLYQHFRKR